MKLATFGTNQGADEKDPGSAGGEWPETWRSKVAESELRRIVLDLKSQRRQIDRAIAALEAVLEGTHRHLGNRQRARRAQQGSSSETGNGTTGQVVPFVREFQPKGS